MLRIIIAGLVVFFSVPAKAQDSVVRDNVTNEQTRLCTEITDCPLGKSFLEYVNGRTDGFENAPVDIKYFVEDAATCEHFAGEEPYDMERRKEIIEGLKSACSSAQTMLSVLKTKYKNDAAAGHMLAVCEKGSKAVCASFDAKSIIE